MNEPGEILKSLGDMPFKRYLEQEIKSGWDRSTVRILENDTAANYYSFSGRVGEGTSNLKKDILLDERGQPIAKRVRYESKNPVVLSLDFRAGENTSYVALSREKESFLSKPSYRLAFRVIPRTEVAYRNNGYLEEFDWDPYPFSHLEAGKDALLLMGGTPNEGATFKRGESGWTVNGMHVQLGEHVRPKGKFDYVIDQDESTSESMKVESTEISTDLAYILTAPNRIDMNEWVRFIGDNGREWLNLKDRIPVKGLTSYPRPKRHKP